MKNVTIWILLAAAAAWPPGLPIYRATGSRRFPRRARAAVCPASSCAWTGTRITGTWNQLTVTGSTSGDHVNLALSA